MSVLEEFIKTSNKAKTEKEVFSCFSKALRKLGFDAETYFYLNPGDMAEKSPYKVMLTTAPPQVIDIYMGHKIEQVNLTHNIARLSGKSFNWFDKPSGIELDKEYKYFLSEVNASGFNTGFAIPIYGQGTEVAFVDIGKYHAKIDMKAEEIHIARLLSYHLHERIKSILNDENRMPVLSPREKEVLQWVMAGKSDSVIADIMKISEHTVDTYLRRCYQKLEVSNRVAAVVKALSLGIITP